MIRRRQGYVGQVGDWTFSLVGYAAAKKPPGFWLLAPKFVPQPSSSFVVSVKRKTPTMQVQKITPFLWFDNNAEEAMNFYVSVFKNSKVLSIHHSGKAGPGEDGTVMVVHFELDGVRFVGLNGGPMNTFSEAISFWVYCDTQEEIDDLWEKLTAGGGEPSKCGWLKDKFGLSWQIVPSILLELLDDKDPVKRDNVLRAVWEMEKLDTRKLQEAVGR